MIIGIDASRANKKIKTGVEWYAYHLIQTLKTIDKKNRYFLYTNKKLSGGLEKCPDNFEEKILSWPPKYLWTQIRLSWEMKFGKNKPDVLFVPAHTIPIFHPKNSIVTVHDVGFARFPKLYNWMDKLYHNWIMKFIKKHAKKIITISKFSKQEIIELYNIEPEKIAIIYNGFNQMAYRPVEKASTIKKVLQKYQLTKPFFLNIARLEYKKNILGLIKAFKIFQGQFDPDKKYQLVLAGGGGQGYVDILQEIEKQNLKDSIIILGWVNEADLPKLLNASTAFVFPSFYEGFGIPILEAMSCGTPVITSNVASLPEVAGDAALLIDPYDSEKIAQAMNKIITDEDLCNELTRKGFKQIKKFSWQRCAREVLNILEKTLQ